MPLLNAGCGKDKTPLPVIVAGSFMVPIEELEAAFEQLHPDIDVQIEGHGSIQVIRQVTELDKEADVLIVADYSLIPMMMYNTTVDGSGESYADWYISFATNSLGLAYTDTSIYSDEINRSNWYEILSRPEVTIGISDARVDSCGYRAFMACQLAEGYYNNSSIFESLFSEMFTWPVTVSFEDGVDVIRVPEILQPDSRRMALRGNSVYLLFLLDSGDIDYAFQYRSVAEQHGYKFLELPAQIDLSSEDYAESYENVTVKMDFQRFGSVQPEFAGEPIVYGVTIPNNAPYPDIAADFVSFLISAQGQAILTANDHPPIVPARADNPDALPDGIKDLLPQ
ncbi:MAG: tungstate ABC transporter substrate-binding protein WtpA [Dehalococcoidia bacterium]